MHFVDDRQPLYSNGCYNIASRAAQSNSVYGKFRGHSRSWRLLLTNCLNRKIYCDKSSSHSQFVIWATILKKKAFWRTMGYHTFSRDALWSMALLGHGGIFLIFFCLFQIFLYFYKFSSVFNKKNQNSK